MTEALLPFALSLALAVSVFELGWLLLRRRAGWPAAAAQAAAGAALLFGLQLALHTGESWSVLACVAGGGLAHAAGLLLRRLPPASC